MTLAAMVVSFTHGRGVKPVHPANSGSRSVPGSGWHETGITIRVVRNDQSVSASMNQSLAGRMIAILVADGFEESEMTGPRRALDAAGARTCLVSLHPGEVQAWKHDHFGTTFAVDRTVDQADVRAFDALFLPGGVLNPGALRGSREAVRFVRDFFAAQKPVAAICNGLHALIAADVVQDRTVTSFPSVRSELVKAGANWVDAAVVVDRGLVTSRSPADLELFNAKMIEQFAGDGR